MDTFNETRNNPEKWGRLVENAVGTYILNNLGNLPFHLYYWHERDFEVDFVLASPNET